MAAPRDKWKRKHDVGPTPPRVVRPNWWLSRCCDGDRSTEPIYEWLIASGSVAVNMSDDEAVDAILSGGALI